MSLGPFILKKTSLWKMANLSYSENRKPSGSPRHHLNDTSSRKPSLAWMNGEVGLPVWWTAK